MEIKKNIGKAYILYSNFAKAIIKLAINAIIIPVLEIILGVMAVLDRTITNGFAKNLNMTFIYK